MWCGGDVVDIDFLCNNGRDAINNGAINLGDWAWDFNFTDRVREPIPVASADVFHIYNMLLSYMFMPPRTFALTDMHSPRSEEHTSWAFLLRVETEECGDVDLSEDEDVIEAITAARMGDEEREYSVHWDRRRRPLQAVWGRLEVVPRQACSPPPLTP